jgi:hypothetical protein
VIADADGRVTDVWNQSVGHWDDIVQKTQLRFAFHLKLSEKSESPLVKDTIETLKRWRQGDRWNGSNAKDYTDPENGCVRAKALGTYPQCSREQTSLPESDAKARLLEETSKLEENSSVASGEVAVIDWKTYPILDGFMPFKGAGEKAVRIDAPMEDFVRLMVSTDAGLREVPHEYYMITHGSTIVTLKEGYLKTFPNGKVNFVATFRGGVSQTLPLVVEMPNAPLPVPVAPSTASPTPRTPSTTDDSAVYYGFGGSNDERYKDETDDLDTDADAESLEDFKFPDSSDYLGRKLGSSGVPAGALLWGILALQMVAVIVWVISAKRRKQHEL